MTIEEKAKRYEEALERARMLNNGKDVDVEAGTTTCEYIFPELKESEDERIRKDLIKYLESDRDCQPCQDVSFYDSGIAWLEKQKINTEGDFGREYDCGYKACLHSHGAEWLEKQKEQKPDKLTWEDARRLYLIWREVSNELDACSENFPKWSSSTKDMFNEVLRRFYENDSSGI